MNLLELDDHETVAPRGLMKLHVEHTWDVGRAQPIQIRGIVAELANQTAFGGWELAEEGLVDGCLAMHDARHVEHGIGHARTHVAGVLAERRLGLAVSGVHVPFDHDLGAGRDLQIDRLALHQLDRFARYAAGDRKLVDPVAAILVTLQSPTAGVQPTMIAASSTLPRRRALCRCRPMCWL